MNWTLPNSSTSFHLGDVSTSEPHLYCSGSLTDHRYLSRREHDARKFHLQAAAALHLPRLTLMACGAAAVLFGFVALARAEGPAPTLSAGRTTAECARRDLATIEFIEQRGDARDLPSAKLGEIGLMQLEARLRCTAEQEASALAIYDSVLNANRVAERVQP